MAKLNRWRLISKVLAGPCFGMLVLMGGAAWSNEAVSNVAGWQLERDVDPPSYAVIEPASTNLDIDALVLMCDEGEGGRALHFELYTTEADPLMPVGADRRNLRNDPRAEITVDGRIYPVSLFFAEDYVVLADAASGRFPVLSEGLLDALEKGNTMILRFDLVAKRAGQRPAFDGVATIDLKAGRGGSAVAAVRRCTQIEPAPVVGDIPRPRANGVVSDAAQRAGSLYGEWRGN